MGALSENEIDTMKNILDGDEATKGWANETINYLMPIEEKARKEYEECVGRKKDRG